MHHMYELHRASTGQGCSPLAGCDVRLRLGVGLAAIVAVVLSTRSGLGFAVAAACLASLLIARVPLRTLIARLAFPLALAALLGLTQLFATPGAGWFQLRLGPWLLTATWEGLWRGVLLSSRVSGAVALAVTITVGVPATQWFAALAWARVPSPFIEIAALMYRYVFTFFEQALSITAAQKVRLGYSTLGRTYRSLGCLAGMVVLRSLDQAEKSHEAMTARAYQGRLPLPQMPPLAARQWLCGVAGVLAVAALYALVERWPL